MKKLALERAECATEGDISSSRLQLAPSPRPDVNFRKICRPQLGLDLLYCPSFYGKSAADLVFQQLETQLSPFFSRCQQTVTLAGRVQPIPRRHAAFGDPGLFLRCEPMAVDPIGQFPQGSRAVGARWRGEVQLCPGQPLQGWTGPHWGAQGQ